MVSVLRLTEVPTAPPVDPFSQSIARWPHSGGTSSSVRYRPRTTRGRQVGILEQRRRIMEDNNGVLRGKEDDEYPSYRLTLQCECGGPGCAESVEVSIRDAVRVRKFAEEGTFIAVRGHDIPELESASDALTDGSWIQVTPLPSWDTSVDVHTLEARMKAEEAEANANRHEVEAAYGRLNALVATGVLVLGLFTTLRPNNIESLPLPLVLAPLVPLLGLLWEAVFQAASIRNEVRRAFSPGRHVTRSDLDEWERSRYRLRPQSDDLSAGSEYVRPPGISYESALMYSQAKKYDLFLAEAYLPYGSYLGYETQRQARRRIVTLNAIYAIDSREIRSRGLLALLVFYVILVTATA